MPRVGQTWRATGEHTQVECNAPLSLASYRLEKHHSPAWGANAWVAPTKLAPGAAEQATAEQQKTQDRRRMQAEERERFRNQIRKRVAAAYRQKKTEAMREMQQQQAQELHAAASAQDVLPQLVGLGRPARDQACVPSVSVSDGTAKTQRPPAVSPTSVLQSRIEQVRRDAFCARELLLTEALSGDGCDAEDQSMADGSDSWVPLSASPTSSSPPPLQPSLPVADMPAEVTAKATPLLSTSKGVTPRLALVRSQWSAAERSAATERRDSERQQKRAARERSRRQVAEATARAEAKAAELKEVRAHEQEQARVREAYDLVEHAAMQAGQQRQQKTLEAERFAEARRQQLREEVALRPRALPPLCCCGLDPLENHVDHCARYGAPLQPLHPSCRAVAPSHLTRIVSYSVALVADCNFHSCPCLHAQQLRLLQESTSILACTCLLFRRSAPQRALAAAGSRHSSTGL